MDSRISDVEKRIKLADTSDVSMYFLMPTKRKNKAEKIEIKLNVNVMRERAPNI